MPDGIITIIYVIVIIILLAAVIKLMKAREKNLDRKAAKALIGSAADGRIPEKDSISSYYKAKLQSCEEYVDDITMKDLDFDKVFGKIDSVSSITKKPRSIDKNKQKWYNRSARKIAENSKKACTWGGAYV